MKPTEFHWPTLGNETRKAAGNDKRYLNCSPELLNVLLQAQRLYGRTGRCEEVLKA